MDNELVYSVNLDKIVKLFQMKLVERVLENKYGQNHARVLRILKQHRSLEDKKVSEAALISLKDTRSILMELYAD